MPDVRVVTARPHRLLFPLIARIGELHRRGEPCILLVPEQFTLQAERELLRRLGLKGLFTIEVLSPTRLKHRVLAETGSDDRIPLSSSGRQMAVSFALEACEGKMTYYRASVSRRGFTQKLTALIADMKRGGLQPDVLAAYASGLPQGMRREKLSDLAVLYNAYQDTLKDRFGDGDDENRLVASRIAESGLLKNRHMFVYGFDELTEPLIALLCATAKECRSLAVGLVSDGAGAADQELYLPVRRSVARFRKALEAESIVLREEQLPKETLGHTPAVAYLDEVLYAHPQKRFSGEQTGVCLSAFNSPFEEATAAARQILSLYESGTALERIAVLYPEQNGYPFAVPAAFLNSGLPFYTDEKLPSLAHGLPQFLLSSLRAMETHYRNDHVIALLKTGYAAVSFEEACVLENYSREYGINFGRWLSPFTKGGEASCQACEEIRRKIIRPLESARRALVEARDAAQSLQAVMDLLTDVNAYDTLKKEEEALLQEGLLVRAGQNSQIWQAVLELLDQLFILSGGRRIPLNRIADRLESGFGAISLASLPPAANMLHAGVLGHSLSGEMDAVFLLGMNDGILTRGSESLLTDEERAQTQEGTDTYLGMTEESRLSFARLDLKRAMTLPREKLYISYAKTDPAGNPLLPLDLINDLSQRLFDGMPDIEDTLDELPISAQQALVAIGDLLREYAGGDERLFPEPWRRRLAALLRSPATAPAAMRLIRAVGFHTETLPLTPETARSLFGERTLSVSRLEDFAACPFRHYVTFGLHPEEQKDWAVTPIETGNFFHLSLQNFVSLACADPQFPNIAPETVEQLADAACASLEDEIKRGPMGDGPRSLAALAQASRVVRRACASVTEHIAAGQFRLDGTETRFGYPGDDSFPPVVIPLPDGTEITLHGRIDRVDRLETQNTVYRRVVDYKSGAGASVDPAELWHGAQLQLMLYLDAVTCNTGGAKPAGAFYFHLFDPMSKADGETPEENGEDIRRQMQMNGIALADPDVLQAMDGTGNAVVIPSAVTQGGTLRKNAKAMDAPHLDALIAHARRKAAQFSGGIFAGDISVQPLKHGTKESCDFCDYRSICGYDPLAGGVQGKEIFSMTMEELGERLDRENTSET